MEFVKDPTIQKPVRKISWLKWAAIPLSAVIIFLALAPVTRNLSSYYLQNGNSLLLERKYLSARLSYEKALLLNSKNTEANTQKELARKAESDILVLEDLYEAQNQTEELRKISWANSIPSDETEAVKLSRQFIESKDYQLATIAAKTATQMDPDYKDAWVYLGISNMKVAEILEISPESKNKYIAESKKAFDKVREIDPEYEDIKNLYGYLDKITI